MVLSDLTRRELEQAPEAVRAMVTGLPEEAIENVFLGPEARELADAYIHDGVVTKKHLADAQHIAIATVERVDVLASWNFREIVNLGRIRAFNAANLKRGYIPLEMRSPWEVLDEEEI